MGKPRAIVNWEGVDGVGLHISNAGQERSRHQCGKGQLQTEQECQLAHAGRDETRSGASRATGSMKGNDGLCERS